MKLCYYCPKEKLNSKVRRKKDGHPICETCRSRFRYREKNIKKAVKRFVKEYGGVIKKLSEE